MFYSRTILFNKVARKAIMSTKNDMFRVEMLMVSLGGCNVINTEK